MVDVVVSNRTVRRDDDDDDGGDDDDDGSTTTTFCRLIRDSTRSLDSTATRQRLYFDWNLLSTLPINVEETSGKSVWPAMYDPWDELAMGIWEFVARKKAGQNA